MQTLQTERTTRAQLEQEFLELQKQLIESQSPQALLPPDTVFVDSNLENQLHEQQTQRLQLERHLAALEYQLAEQSAPIEPHKLDAHTVGDQEALHALLMAQRQAQTKLEQQMVALQSQLALQPALLESQLASSLVSEREARSQLQQQVEDAQLRLQAKQPDQIHQAQQPVQLQHHQAQQPVQLHEEHQPIYNEDTQVSTEPWAFNLTLVKQSPQEKYGLQLHQEQEDGFCMEITVANVVPGSVSAQSGMIAVGDQVPAPCTCSQVISDCCVMDLLRDVV